MKYNITLLPLKGIIINDALNIRFGQTFEKVASEMKLAYSCTSNKMYILDNNICFEFDDEKKLIFIEISKCDEIIVKLFEQYPLKLKDDELMNYLFKYCKCDESELTDYSEITEYCFKSQSIALYRGISPYELLLSIEDAKKEGYYDECMETEYEEACYFDVISIGIKEYFDFL